MFPCASHHTHVVGHLLRDRWAVVTGTAPASSGDRRDYPGHRLDETIGVVLSVHDQQVAVVVTPDGLGCPQVAVSAGLWSPL